MQPRGTIRHKVGNLSDQIMLTMIASAPVGIGALHIVLCGSHPNLPFSRASVVADNCYWPESIKENTAETFERLLQMGGTCGLNAGPQSALSTREMT